MPTARGASPVAQPTPAPGPAVRPLPATGSGSVSGLDAPVPRPPTQTGGPVPASAGADPFRTVGLTVSASGALAATAARADVAVDDAEPRQQLVDLRAEAAQLAQTIRDEALASVASMKSMGAADQGELQTSGDEYSLTWVLKHRGADGQTDAFTCITIGREQPPFVDFEQTVRAGENWVSHHQVVTGEGQHLELKAREEVSRYQKRGPTPYDHNPFTAPDRLERNEITIKTDGASIEREERHWAHDGSQAGGPSGRPADEVRRITFHEVPAGKLELPGEIEHAFDRGLPVLERKVSHHVEPRLRRVHVLEQETSWFQGQTRVTSQVADGQKGLLLEKQSADGLSKDSQLFIKGTENTVRTHAEARPDGTVKEVQQLWDSNGKTLGHSLSPELLNTATTHRTYGSDGELATQHKTTVDSKTGEGRTDDYSRRVSGNTVSYQVKSTVVGPKGTPTFSSFESAATLSDDGELPDTTTVKNASQEVELRRLGDHGVSYQCRTLATGKVVTGQLQLDADGVSMTLTVDGKSARLGGGSDPDLKKALAVFDPDELAGLSVALHEVPRFQNVKGLVGFGLQQGEKVAGAVNPWIDGGSFVQNQVDRGLRLASSTVHVTAPAELLQTVGNIANFLGVIGVGTEAVQSFVDLKGRDYLKASLRAGKVGVTGAQTASRLFAHLTSASMVLRGLGVAGSALTLGLDALNLRHADNKFDRLEAASGVVSGGLQMGLVLTATSGPSAPFLLGGLILFQGVKFYADYRNKQYVAPLAAGLAATSSAPSPR